MFLQFERSWKYPPPLPCYKRNIGFCALFRPKSRSPCYTRYRLIIRRYHDTIRVLSVGLYGNTRIISSVPSVINYLFSWQHLQICAGYKSFYRTCHFIQISCKTKWILFNLKFFSIHFSNINEFSLIVNECENKSSNVLLKIRFKNQLSIVSFIGSFKAIWAFRFVAVRYW